MAAQNNGKSWNLISWLVYDAANSFLATAIGGFCLAQWVVLDNGFDDIWYGGTFTLATIFVLLTSPFWGAWSDRHGRECLSSGGSRRPHNIYALLVWAAASGLAPRLRYSSPCPNCTKPLYLPDQPDIYNALLKVVSTPKNRVQSQA
jgi:MFS family permease